MEKRKRKVEEPEAPAATKKKRTADYDVANQEYPEGVTLQKVEGEDLEIKKIETSKDLIEQPRLAADERMIIPKLGSSIIINGISGSGKSTLLANYITNPQFFGKCKEKPNGWFDKIFLFSPTASGDDVQKALGIPKNHVYTDLDEAPELLNVILESQKEKLDGGGKAHKVPQYCVIFDDVIGETSFMLKKEFLQTFYMVRHRNCTTFICSQHFKRVPKVARLQASFIHFFAGSAAEVEQIVDDYAPPLYSRHEFRDLVHAATKGHHAFLTICMKIGWEFRFRRNLSEFISLDRLVGNDEEEDDKEPKKGTRKRNAPNASQHKGPKKTQISVDESKTFHQNLKIAVDYFKRKHEQNEQTRKKFRRSQD